MNQIGEHSRLDFNSSRRLRSPSCVRGAKLVALLGNEFGKGLSTNKDDLVFEIAHWQVQRLVIRNAEKPAGRRPIIPNPALLSFGGIEQLILRIQNPSCRPG